MKKNFCSILATLTLTFSLCILANAQDITGSIVGTVKDSTGASVAGASVTVTDPNKNNVVVRTATTTDDGTFSIPNVAVSSYTVTIEAPNFKRSVNTNVKVDLAQRRNLDVVLAAGRIDEVVTVSADPVAVELSTPTAGTTISGDQVRELSINNRNWIQLVTLAPGVSSNLSDQVYVGNFNPDGQANTAAISVNGARQSQNTFTVDGADITDRGSNITIQTFPSVDSIGEFKVLRALYPAESGRSGGGQINVVTRSGTDEFHGSAFEFVRNERFNANSFFNNRNAPLGKDANGKAKRLPFRYNNYGFTIGGPVYFLNFGNHDADDGFFTKYSHTYFFFSEEQRKDRRSVTLGPALIPNQNMRNGIFSVPICLSGTISSTGARGCNQVLPAGTALSTLATINPVAQSYITNIYNRLPQVTSAPFSLTSAIPYKADFEQEILKIDTAFTKNWTAYYRFERDKIPTSEVNSIFGGGSGIPFVSPAAVNSPGRTHTFQTSYVFSPNIIADARYTYAYGAILLDNVGLIARENSPVAVNLPYGNISALVPNLAISGLNTLTAFGNYDNFSDKNEITGNLTWISGKHTMKFGGLFSKYRKNENQLGGIPQGQFSAFNNSTLDSPVAGTICINATTGAPTTCSGNSGTEQNFANFLLGNNLSFTQMKFDLTADFRQRNVEAYAQDEFRVTNRLTLYYGLRYSFFGAPWDRNGFLSNFDPHLYDPSTAPDIRGNGFRVSGSGNYCDGLIVNTNNFVTGPASFQCNPTPSPYGKFIYKAPKLNLAPRVGFAWDPFGKGTTAVRMGYGIYFEQVLNGTIEQQLGVNPPFQEQISVSGVSLDQPIPAGSSPAVVATDNPPNLIRGWEPEFKTPYMQHWSLDLQHQFGRNTIVSVGYYGSKGTNLIGIVDINNLPPGYALKQKCAVGTSITPTVDCQATNPTTNLPVAFLSSGSELILDQIRPYKGWRNIQMTEPAFDSNYHSLQVSATRRFGGASQVQLAYTWSKNLTNNQTDRSTAVQNYYDVHQDYGRAQLDRRHILTVNYVYELPWFTHRHDLVGNTLGGWQVSGIVTYQTGLPFTVTYSGFDPAGIGFLGSSPVSGRAFLIGDPNTGGAQTREQWFNTAAFLQPPTPSSFAAVPGTAARGIVEGPPTFRVDFTVAKNIRFTESMRLQLRAEAFNVLNHTNFTTLGTTASTTSTFGTVTGTRDPRVLQFGIKFYF
jgi:hypothetical protein